MYPQDYFATNKFLHKLSGQHIPHEHETLRKKLLWYAYNAFWVAYCQLYYTPAELAKLGETSGNTNDFIEHVGMICMHWLGVAKVVTWFTRRKTIEKLRKLLDDDAFKYEDYENFKPALVVTRSRNIFHGCAIFFFICASMVPISKILEGGADYFAHGDLIDGVNHTCQAVLPYFAWFPFYTETKMRCGLAFVVQIFPMVFYAWQIISYDMTFTSLALYLRAHLINIQGAFRSLRGRCLRRLQIKDDYVILHDEDYPRLNEEINGEMRRLTVHLQTVIMSCDKMEDIFTLVTLMQTMVTLFVLVSCLYVMSHEPLFSPAFTAEMDFFIGAYVQLGFCCTFGNEITVQSEAIVFAIYETDWYSASASFKSSMLINMRRMQRPLVLTVGKFTPLTLSTLVSVLRGSYSYFAVLKQTQ